MKLPQDYRDLSTGERRIVREQYVKDQDGKCYYCNGSLKGDAPSEITNKKIDWRFFPENFLRYPIHLHHDHKTGMTLGAVHNYCNAVLWQYENE